jgi:hypothetical protein
MKGKVLSLSQGLNIMKSILIASSKDVKSCWNLEASPLLIFIGNKTALFNILRKMLLMH